MNCTVLIVDDDRILAESLADFLQTKGCETHTAHNAAAARQAMVDFDPDIALVDLQMPDGNGAELVAALKKRHPATEFIIVTGHGSIQSAVQSTKSGAFDYITKPFEPEQIARAVRAAANERARVAELQRLRNASGCTATRPACPESIRAAGMRRTITQARKAAQQDGIVLILGESGCGKDHLAQRIHSWSPRAAGPFFAINCAALPRELAESELFGHEPGAFSGSRGRKRGLLELAENGSLLLDEIGDLDLSLQAKLLTFLDTRSFVRVGGERSIHVNARILAATNADLAAAVAEKRFRADLFYRLNVLPILVPPLRERVEDLPDLVQTLLGRLAMDLGLSSPPRLGAGVIEALQSYRWPGNIRELRNVLERALMLSAGGEISVGDLSVAEPDPDWHYVVRFPSGECLRDVTKEVTRHLVVEALRRSPSKQEAARLLGLSRHSLAYQLRLMGMDDTGDP